MVIKIINNTWWNSAMCLPLVSMACANSKTGTWAVLFVLKRTFITNASLQEPPGFHLMKPETFWCTSRQHSYRTIVHSIMFWSSDKSWFERKRRFSQDNHEQCGESRSFPEVQKHQSGIAGVYLQNILWKYWPVQI